MTRTERLFVARDGDSGVRGLRLLGGVALCALALLSAGQAADVGQPGEVEVLNHATYWRTHITWRMAAIGTAARANEGKVDLFEDRPDVGRWIRSDFSFPTPLPEEGWTAAGFDDASWVRRQAPLFGDYGDTNHPDVALVALRGRFGVTDPAKVKGLKLALEYRGGAVVYLNGTEVARGNLPQRKIDLLTLAEDYPLEAFVSADGTARLPAADRRTKPAAELQARYTKRIRALTVDLPASALVKGANVLALELHRSAIPDGLPELPRTSWDTTGLVSVKVSAAPGSAVETNAGPPQRVQVWSATALERPGHDARWGDPFEGQPRIPLQGPRNGVASGQVVVSYPEEPVAVPIPDPKAPKGKPPVAETKPPLPAYVKPVSATATELKGERAVIPLSAVRVRYAGAPDAGFVPLLEQPAPQIHQPVWVTVKIPADAPAGTYRGTLTVQAQGLPQPVSVPIELTVYDWRVGDPAEWKTSVNVLQSPQCVAGVYKAPLWSDRHFQLMEKSFALMGYAGNSVLGISAVGKTVFGDDPQIVFRKEGEKYVPDFRFLKRYLTLYNKCAGAPRWVSLQVWHYGLHYDGRRRDGRKPGYDGPYPWYAKTIAIHELRGDTPVPSEMPIYGEPGTEEVWKQVLAGVRGVLKELGWEKTRLMLGTSGDEWPSAEQIAFFKTVAPGAQWRVATHGSSVSRWGETPERRTQANGMTIAYANMVRRGVWKRPRPADAIAGIMERDGIGSSPLDYIGLGALSTVGANYDGYCWQGLDYWGYTGEDGRVHRALAEYVGFGNIIPHRPMSVALPGADGCVATSQFELLREGNELSEAMIFIRDTLADPAQRAKISEGLAFRAGELLQATCDTLESGRRMSPAGSGDTRRQITLVYRTAAEIGAALAKGSAPGK